MTNGPTFEASVRAWRLDSGGRSWCWLTASLRRKLNRRIYAIFTPPLRTAAKHAL